MSEENKKAEGAPAEASKSADPAPEVGQMKRGDYMIHVFIEQARQIKCPEGSTVDPMIEVTCMNQKKFTTAKDNLSAASRAVWNEHLFFEPKNVKVEDIEQAKISIRMLDKGFMKDALIGVYEFDVTYIYFMKQHSLMHKWLALSDPNSENFNEVTSYLKISITIAATGDEQVQITEETGADKTDEAIMMPPSIRPEYYQVKFRFFRAEKLPALDKGLLGGAGKIDAYILCNFMNKKLKTEVKVQKEGGFIDWDQEFLVPCQLPIMSSRVVMKIFDEDNISDEIVGSILFNMKDCIGPLNGQFFWKNIYGAPIGCSGGNTNKMNENPETASTWKGRVLMQILAEKTEKPQLSCQKIPQADIKAAEKYMQEREYEIIAEIGQGVSLPSNDKYTVIIKIADHEFKTGQPQTADNTYNRWNYRVKQTTIKTPYQDISDIGRIYVYLVVYEKIAGEKLICFYKGDIDDFLDPNPQMKFFQLVNDLAVGRVTDCNKAGLLSFKLSIHDKSAKGPIQYDQFKAWKKLPPKRMDAKKVRVYIFQCRDLPAADSDGQSDPFLTLWDCTDIVKKTKVVEDNLNPLFYETHELSIECSPDNVEDMPPFIIDVWDWDTLGNDFIARCCIPVKDCAFSEDDTVPEPKWHPCCLNPGSPPCGDILISFSIVEDDFNYKIPLAYMNLKDNVDFDEYDISINILGLRNLQSVGLLPVKKAFIVFNLKSLVSPDDGAAVENIKTQPSAAGCNPTINTLIQFKIGLPTAPLYCPRLSCTVHDYIFKGFSQPTIGAFTIPIGDLIHKLINEREVETEAIRLILIELDNILKDQGIQTYDLRQLEQDSQYTLLLAEGPGQSEVTEKMKSQVKVADEQMRTPLLLNIMTEEEEKKQPSRPASVRSTNQPATPARIQLSQEGASKKSKGNSLKVQAEQKFNPELKCQMLKEYAEAADKNKRDFSDIRKKELEEFKAVAKKGEASRNIILPTYELDTRLGVHRETRIPPASAFLPLGWDENPEQKKKHYRRFYPDELENIKEVMPVASPFDQYNCKKGQSRGASKGWFSNSKEDESGAGTTEQVAGKFKGIITVQTKEAKEGYEKLKKGLIDELSSRLSAISMKKTGKPIDISKQLEKMDTMEGRMKFEQIMDGLGVGHLMISKQLSDLESDETIKRKLLATTKCIVRLYVISAYDLASRDNGGESDPYLKLTLGNKTFNERNNYQLDQPNPDFYKSYDFEAVFPGCPPLIIEAMDYDDIFGDDEIGTTSIDLEDRFFSPEWQSLRNKPIEYRQIYHPSTSVSQGVIKMWVEITPVLLKAEEKPKLYNISPKPFEQFEVRVSVFDTLDIKMMDAEGTSDAFCKVYFDSKQEVHETDTHFRCQDGKASFNYRLVYTIQDNRKDYILTIQCYDRDFFKSNDIIGEGTIDLAQLVEDSALTKRPLTLNEKYYKNHLVPKGIKLEFKDDSSFWIKLMGFDDKAGKMVENGKVRVQIDILPKTAADSNKVGEARQEPNHSPFLPPPIGRLSFSLNPFTMLNQLVGPAMRRKIYLYCCLFMCCALVVALFPLVAGNIVSSILGF